MRLRVLGSGSKGNGYVMYNDSEALVIECGVPYRHCLEALEFNRRKITGAIVSHEHGDHAKYVAQYLEAAIPVYSSKGTADALRIKELERAPRILRNKKAVAIGGFSVLPFDVKHDAAEPFGYLISHREIGTCLFATDTYYLRYTFKGLTQIMLECNYDSDILERNVTEGAVPMIVRNRVYRSHMSIDTCISTLKANDLTKVANIVLLHLSGNNSAPMLFRHKVEEQTGKIVSIAIKGLDIPFNAELW